MTSVCVSKMPGLWVNYAASYLSPDLNYISTPLYFCAVFVSSQIYMFYLMNDFFYELPFIGMEFCHVHVFLKKSHFRDWPQMCLRQGGIVSVPISFCQKLQESCMDLFAMYVANMYLKSLMYWKCKLNQYWELLAVGVDFWQSTFKDYEGRRGDKYLCSCTGLEKC